MARAPEKTCPNLYHLLEDGEATLVAAFLDISAFANFNWLKSYRFDADDQDGLVRAKTMLAKENKVRLDPLEEEAARIVTIAGNRGQRALEGLSSTSMDETALHNLHAQRDDLARSLWTYTNKNALFEAVENVLHQRNYRRYDKHYQTFKVEPRQDGAQVYGPDALDQLLEVLKDQLNRGDGYDVERFQIPAQGGEPAAEMFLLYHPDRPKSVRQIDEDGKRTPIYFRPPGEAMVVYTPSTGRVHVRASSRAIRHTVAETFIETVLEEPKSSQPVDFQAYDLSRFFQSFDLHTPDFEDVLIKRAQVIRAEVSVGNLSNRLALSTTINEDIDALIDQQAGLRRIFERAVAIRFIEIAVRYARSGVPDARTLDFKISDSNTSSLLSLEDPFEREFGHRLLRAWGILREGRPPKGEEAVAVIPMLLQIWDARLEQVHGAWFEGRGVDVNLLVDLGFLVPKGWEDDDILDDEDDFGLVDAGVQARPGGADLTGAEGEGTPAVRPDQFRLYRVRQDWVAEHLKKAVSEITGKAGVTDMNQHAMFLGSLPISNKDVPVYLVRALDDEKIRASIDTELRARSDQGIGLVLQAGNVPGSCLAANVLTPLAQHILGDGADIRLDLESLGQAFRYSRAQAKGGEAVEVINEDEHGGTLLVPGKGTVYISGAQRLLVIKRLVEAYRNGTSPVRSGNLRKGMEDQSFSSIFGSVLWKKLQDGFVRSPRNQFWEIDA